MAQFVDWDLAAATAGALGKTGPRASYGEATEVVGDLRRLTEEAAGHVSDYTGLRSQVAHPPVRIVDRRDWAMFAGCFTDPVYADFSGGGVPAATVSRADLAACMLASLSDPATVHRHVAIAS